jgi:hypothetical protein
VSRLTKQIRLVLISSSLILPGCQQNQAAGPNCEQRPPGDGQKGVAGGQAAMPSVCGPADGRSTGYGGYHGYGYHFWGFGRSTVNSPGVSSPGMGVSSGIGGKSSTIGSVRGGFGASAHGAGS